MREHVSPRYAIGRRSWKSIMLAFVAGMLATTLVSQARLWDWDGMNLNKEIKSPVQSEAVNMIADNIMTTKQAFDIKRFLQRLKLSGHYSSLLIRRGYDMDSLAKATINDPEPGIKAAHWKTIISEARIAADKIIQSTNNDINHVVSTVVKQDDESIFKLLLEGSDEDEQQEQQQQQSQQKNQPQVIAATNSTKDISLSTPLPTAIPNPPDKTPAICITIPLSENIRVEYLKWKEVTRLSVNGTINFKNKVPICKGIRETVTDKAFNSEFMSEHRTAPARAMSGLRGFNKQRLSVNQIEDLRSSGVIEQLYFDHDLKIAYCAVPKAGCTEVKAWMLNNAGLYKRSRTPHNRTLYTGERIQNGQVMSNERLQQIFSDGEYFKV